jgi:hypothetical protein
MEKGYVELESMLDGFAKDEKFFAEEADNCPVAEFAADLQLAAEVSHANYVITSRVYREKITAEKAEITEQIVAIRAQLEAEIDDDKVIYMTDVIDELCEYLAQLEAKVIPTAA